MTLAFRGEPGIGRLVAREPGGLAHMDSLTRGAYGIRDSERPKTPGIADPEIAFLPSTRWECTSPFSCELPLNCRASWWPVK